jgi:multiple sugar transport system substrate-binding protein
MPDGYSRRDFLAGVLAAGTLSAVAVYFSPGGRPRPSFSLTLASGTDSTGARDRLLDMWNAANPDSGVELMPVSGSTLDQKNKMIAAAEKGTADILNLDTINIRYFAERDLIIPIALDDVEVFIPSTLRAGAIAGEPSRFWAAPFNADVGMLFERAQSRSPLPKTPPSLSQVVDNRALKNTHQFVTQLGPTSSSSEEAFVVNILENALSRDPDILDENGLPVFVLERWREALEPLRAAVRAGRVTAADSEDNSRRIYHKQSLRYMRNWPVHFRVLQQEDDPDAKTGRIRLNPLSPGILGGQSLALVKKSRHTARAADLVRFLTTEAAQRIIAAYGLVATRTAAYSDETLRAVIPHLDAMRGAVENARSRPIHPNYSEFSSIVSRYIMPWLNGDGTLSSRFTDELRDALD